MEQPQEFEIIEITINNEPPETAAHEFLGFDAACVYRVSLLGWGLDIGGEPKGTVAADDLYWTLQPLSRLIQAHFKPQLNKHFLFDDLPAATFFLDTMMALQKLRPNLWEGDDCKFQVLGVWKVFS